jgi:hypothetical protein
VKANEVWNAVNRRKRLVRELREKLAAVERGVLGGGGRKAQRISDSRRLVKVDPADS